uniref:phosphatase PAP2 family protein n=1 Tax=Flavobacterium sp. TaxID=239 RepID=UPI00404ACB0E
MNGFRKQVNIFVIICFSSVFSFGQTIETDSIPVQSNTTFQYKKLIIPAFLIGYGVIGIESDGLKIFNSQIKEEVNEHIDEKITIDDISQYVPFASVYALNALGIQGKNNFKDRTMILGTAYLIMGISVNSLKTITKVERPDGSSNNSFPSGHTATAFMGAEFLLQEYKDVSIWYGISGYAIATGTGIFRMYNDRHWLTDVAAGAGIGILSTKIAYWMQPFLTRICSKSKKDLSGVVLPFYNGNQYGVGFGLTF